MAVLQVGELGPESLAELESAFTNLDKPVYFATHDADMRKVATSGARLSRSKGHLRQTYADEFLGKEGSEEGFVEKVLHGFGDDSIAQLYTMFAVTEAISNLATKKIEWPRLMSYLEQSTRYIRYDLKDENGRYPFHTPAELRPEDREWYDAQMTAIFDEYSNAVATMIDHLKATLTKDPSDSVTTWNNAIRSQACDVARLILPTAVQSSTAIVGSAQAFENQLYGLLADTMQEPRDLARELLGEARKVAPEYFRRVDDPAKGNVTVDYKLRTNQRMREWAKELGIDNRDDETGEEVRLVEVTPVDELDVVKYTLFDASGMSLSGIERVLDQRSIGEKAQILRDYVGDRSNRRHRPGRAFEHPHYTWEIRSDYGIFRDLQRHRMVDDLRWQTLTAQHGHVPTPALAEEAGVADCFRRAYEISENLHEQLTTRYGEDVAQYATMLGHIMRWTITMNAREAFHFLELRTDEKGHPGYRRVANAMHQQIVKVHPVIGGAMNHVNSKTQEEIVLSRLEEERRNARKRGE